MLQPARGYRFTIDPLLLVDFVAASRARAAIDLCELGTGCGVLGLALLKRLPTAKLTAVELQPRLAELARRNARSNELGARAEIVELDLADSKQARRITGARFDWVVSNPPYRAVGRGATNPDEESAIARHELRLPLPRLCAEMRRLLRPNAMGAVIYPAARLAELLRELSAVGLSPRRLRAVHPRTDAPATRVLLSFQKSIVDGKLEIVPPLVERRTDGTPSDELLRISGDSP